MPQVSVIIPTYKHRDFVLATLDSVFAQTFTDYEVIVVNDGSPDDTADVLKPLVEAGRIRYIEQPNAGQAAARNRGLAEAKGEYIAFLDDDDLWPADKLEWQMHTLQTEPGAALVYGSVCFIGPGFNLAAPGEKPDFIEEDAPSGFVHIEYLKRNWMISPGQTLIRAVALQDIKGFDTSIWGADDYDLYIRLAKWGPFIYSKLGALYYRQHTANASKDIFRMYKNLRAVNHKHFGRIPQWKNRRLQHENYRYWRDCCLQLMLADIRKLLAEGDKAQARKIWIQALQLLPPLGQVRNMFYLLRHIR